MKILILTFLIFSCIVITLSQETGVAQESERKHLSLFLGGAVGNFGMKADNFKEIYSNRSISRIYVAGIGDGSGYIVGKYRSFFANGISKTENVGVAGKSEWKQKFYMIGGRLMTKKSPIYLEVLYVMTEAEEKISLADPDFDKLNSEHTTKAQGIAFSLGLSIYFPAPLRIFGEVEYSSMLKLGQTPSGKNIPQLGGICVSGGVMLIL